MALIFWLVRGSVPGNRDLAAWCHRNSCPHRNSCKPAFLGCPIGAALHLCPASTGRPGSWQRGWLQGAIHTPGPEKALRAACLLLRVTQRCAPIPAPTQAGLPGQGFAQMQTANPQGPSVNPWLALKQSPAFPSPSLISALSSP